MNSEDALVPLVLAIGSAILIVEAFVSHSQTSTGSAPEWYSYLKRSLLNVEPVRNRYGNCIGPYWNTSTAGRWLEF